MADINVGAITEALNDKTDRDLRNVDTTAKADAVIDYQEPTAANNYTWYRKYASGWVEQGGQVTNADSQSVTLPVTMADSNYQVLVTMGESDKNPNYSICAGGKTTTGFSIYMSWNHTSKPSMWEVKGMAQQ